MISHLVLTIKNLQGETVENPVVLIRAAGKGEFTPIQYDYSPERKTFTILRLPVGEYQVKAEKGSLNCEALFIRVAEQGCFAELILAEASNAYYIEGNSKVPFIKNERLFGVTFRWSLTPEEIDAVLSPLLQNGFTRITATTDAAVLIEGPVTQSPGEIAGLVFTLLQQTTVLYVGPIVKTRTYRLFPNQFMLDFREGITEENITSFLIGKPFVLIDNSSFNATHFMIEYTGVPGYAMIDAYNALLDGVFVVRMFPNFSAEQKTNVPVVPTDVFVSHIQKWYLDILNMSKAWEILEDFADDEGHDNAFKYGDADRIIAVVDTGIRTTGNGANISHPEFNVNVIKNNGAVTSKVYFTYDYRINQVGNAKMEAGNDRDFYEKSNREHGSGVSGIALASADAQQGMVGIAPNARLLSAMNPGLDANSPATLSLERAAHLILHVTGFDPGWIAGVHGYDAMQVFPAPFQTIGENAPGALATPGADIVNFSSSNGNSTALYDDVFELAVQMGRQRRGVVICAAAGNNDDAFRTTNVWGSDHGSIVVGASSINHLGKEFRSPYSSFSTDTDPGIDICAPSHGPSGGPVGLPPKIPYFLSAGQIIPYAGTLAGNAGNIFKAFQGGILSSFVLTNNIAAGDAVITEAGINAVDDNNLHWIILQKGNSTAYEFHAVQLAGNNANFNGGDTVKQAYTAGVDTITLLSGDFQYTPFGGTSGATPVVSGLVALMLSVNPNLTWLEVREILRETAVPIHLKYNGALNLLGAPINYLGWVQLESPTDAYAMGTKLIAAGLYDTDNNPVIPVVAGPLAIGDTTLVLPAGVYQFSPRDTIRIGIQTTLVAIAGATITVADSTGFGTNPAQKNIRIGRSVDTILVGVLLDPANANQYDPAAVGYPAAASGNYKYINVLSTEDFKIGDVISIGGTMRTIAGFGINALDFGAMSAVYKEKHLIEGRGDESSTIELGADPANALNINIPVTTVIGTTVTTDPSLIAIRHITAINPGNVLVLNAAVVGFTPGTKVELAGTEFRVVKSFDGANTLTIDAVENQHIVPFSVTKGLRADYSLGFGYGRVDAEQAVKAARDYDFTKRDLVIRNYLGDGGTTKTDTALNPIQSPDIWIRNSDDLGAAMLTTLDPDDVSLHQTPEFDITITAYTGLPAKNNLIISGNYVGTVDAEFVVLTDNAGGFQWEKDGGGLTPISPILVGVSRKHTLSDGVTVEFDAAAYAGGEKWTIRAKASPWLIRSGGVKDIRFTPGGAYTGTDEVIYTITVTAPNYSWTKKKLSDNSGMGGAGPIALLPGVHLLDEGVDFTYTQAVGEPPSANTDIWTVLVTNNKRQIYIRVHNKGTLPSFFPSKVNGSQPTNKVRAFLYATTNNTIPEKLEEFAIKRLPDTLSFPNVLPGDKHTIVLQETDFRDSVSKGQLNIGDTLAGTASPANVPKNRIFKFAWPESAVFARNTGTTVPPAVPLRMFVLAEVTPHDGVVIDPATGDPTTGLKVEGNNNISFREIFFASFSFKNDLDDSVLPHFLTVDDAGTVVTTTYTAHIEAEMSAFKSENVSIEITRTAADNSKVVQTYLYDAGAWKRKNEVGVNEAFWMDMLPNMPVVKGTATLAAGNQIRITFKGTYNVNKDFKKISIRAVIKNDEKAEIASKQHDIIISTPSSSSTYESGLGDDATTKKTKFDFYTEYENVMQVAGMEFGPVTGDPTNKFNTTHLLKAAVPSPNGVDAFAVTNGVILVQQNTDDANLVNIILKPVSQGIIDSLNIKYFVYRGILKSSLLTGANVAASGTNDLTTEIHAHPTVNSTTQEVLGYDLSVSKTDADLLETGFLTTGDFVRVPVQQGWTIGKFDQNGTVVAGTPIGFGFDIIIEDVNYKPTFGDVRKGQHVITIGAGTLLEKKTARTKVLNFIDPVAYYGLHFNAKVIAPIPPSEEKLRRNELYNELLVKFINKNVVYLDVRNANGLPFNHYENYGSVSQIKLGYINDENPVTSPAIPYDQDSWPIKILKLSDFTAANAGNTGKKNILRLCLPLGDNNSPVVYMAIGSTFKRFPAQDKKKKRFIDLTVASGGFTNDVKLGLPNVDDAGSTTPCAWYFKIYYMVNTNSGYAAATPFVVPSYQYFDNLFTPVDLPSFFTNADVIKYMASGKEAFFDGTQDLGFAAFVKTGAALDNGRVTFYAIPKNIKIDKKKETDIFKDILGGSSNKPSFNEIVTNVCSGLDLRKRELQLTSGAVSYLDFASDDLVGTGENSTFNFMGITISQGELTSLTSSISPIDATKHPVFINVRSYNHNTDLNGNGYREIVIGLAGVDSSGNFVQPTNTVTLYSSDGRFASSDAAAVAEATDFSDLLDDMTFNNKKKEIQVYKRLKLYPTSTLNIETWDLYNDAGTVQNYGAGEFDYYGNSITGQPIKLTACTRIIILGRKIISTAPVDGNTNFYKILCWYRNKYREGFINECALIDHSKTNRVNIADLNLQVSDAIVVESFLNDARFEMKILDDMFTDTGTAGTSVKLKTLLDNVTLQFNTMVADLSGPSAATFETFYAGQIKHLTQENTLKRDDKDIGATLKRYRDLDTLKNLVEYESYLVFSVSANSTIYDLVKDNPGNWPVLDECFNNPGEVRDNRGPNGGQLAVVNAELVSLRNYIENTNNYPANDPILQSADYLYLKEITDPPTPSPDITSIDEITVMTILDPANFTDGVKPQRLLLSSFVPVDQSMGYIDSDHVFSVCINEMNVSSSNIPVETDLMKMITDTHGTFGSGSGWLAEDIWNYLRDGNTINDLVTGDYTTYDAVSLGRVIRALFFRNPEIGIIYLDQYFKALVQ